MKKNKLMRIASILLVVTLLSTCAISGTFAKYVTKGEGNDAARVAQWGIVIGIDGDSVFQNEYTTDDTNADTITNSVEASDKVHVVAPGTKSEGFTATVSGKPEVAFTLALALSNTQEVVLPAGTYTDYTHLVTKTNDDGTTKTGYFDTFTLDEDYRPVKITMTVSGLTETPMKFTGSLKQITDILENIAKGMGHDDGTLAVDLPANQEIPKGTKITLSWEWPFDGNDAADTFIANAAAAYQTGDIDTDIFDESEIPEGFNYEVGYTFTATATQID